MKKKVLRAGRGRKNSSNSGWPKLGKSTVSLSHHLSGLVPARPSRFSLQYSTMPFWSRGDSDESKPQESKDFTSDDLSGFSSSDTNFASSSSLGNGGGDDPMMASATGLGDIQQFSIALRQQMMVQTVINTLTDKAFEKCITGKPGDSLSGKEVACVHATVSKWLDTNEFMNGRMARKMG